ncbi:Ig-like domain-containing protein [Photobacterium damselae]|uniref:Ig-like domain-containing protein n=1 Tax=Photobacterium damselae TaxID=38293 RepID=UPI001594797B|nr:Ig-like domain-containing protein [Photobacterium damselae]NVH46726.1 Ig-like domain-containing protein [Photobacterium damselae subsp. damselae]
MYRIILLILFLISAVGCNTGSNTDHEEATVQPPIASNVFSQVVTSDEIKNISLKEQIRDPQGLPLELLSVEPETEGCPEPLVNATDLSYSIDTDSTGTCLYKYTVKNVSNNRANDKLTSSENFVLISDSGVEDILPAISRTTTISTDVTIDLKSELGSLLPDDYILDEPITVFGTGIAEVLDPSNSTILFHASNNPGVVRLLYSISNDSTLDVKAGYIDISVSGDGNTAPTAKNETLDGIKIDTDVIFDVSALIEDTDSDPLQLIDVYSVNNVAHIKDEDKDDINNTKFTFHTNEYGKFDVSYVVYDHRDGFAVGVISFRAGSENVPWSDITEKGQFVVTTYTAPITEQYARSNRIKYSGTHEFLLDGVSYNMALMNFEQSLDYCSSRGLNLPTTNLDFHASIKRHIPDGLSLTDYYKWPENINYNASFYSSWDEYLELLKEGKVTVNSFAQVYLSDDTVSANFWDFETVEEPDSADPALVTCTRYFDQRANLVKDHAYASDVNDDSNPKIYNTIELAEVYNGNPSFLMPRWYAPTYVYSDSPSISFDSNNVPATEDETELAKVKVYSRKAGQFIIKSVSRGQTVSTTMHFDQDSVSALSTDTSVKLIKNKSKTLSVTATYMSDKTEVMTADKLTFTSSDDSVAKVDGSGKITALQAGDAVITTTLISDNSVQVTTNVHVVKYSGIVLRLPNFIYYGQTANLRAVDTISGDIIPSSELTYQSLTDGVSVSTSGVVSAGNKPVKASFKVTLKDDTSIRSSIDTNIVPEGAHLGASGRNTSSTALVFDELSLSSGPYKVGDKLNLAFLNNGSLNYHDFDSPPVTNASDVASVTYDPIGGSYYVTLIKSGTAAICASFSPMAYCLNIKE